MATHKYKVAMHCTDKEPIEVNSLATNVAADMTTNGATFTPTGGTTTPAQLTTLINNLTTENNKLSRYIAGAKGNHNIMTLRDSETITVYNILNTSFRTLVDTIANGVKAIIELAGFSPNVDATIHTIPDVPVITSINDKNKAAGAAKIILKKHKKIALRTAPAAKKTRGLKYSAQTTPAPAIATSIWTTDLQSVSSTDLLLINLVKSHEIAIRVRAEDGKLKSAWSTSVEFTSRTSAPAAPTTMPTP